MTEPPCCPGSLSSGFGFSSEGGADRRSRVGESGSSVRQERVSVQLTAMEGGGRYSTGRAVRMDPSGIRIHRMQPASQLSTHSSRDPTRRQRSHMRVSCWMPFDLYHTPSPLSPPRIANPPVEPKTTSSLRAAGIVFAEVGGV